MSHVAVEHRIDLELAPIPRLEMEAWNAPGRVKKSNLATKILAQVKKVTNLLTLQITIHFQFLLQRFTN